MATRPKFAKMANYSCECVEASHILVKNGLWRMWSSLASIQNAFGEFGEFRNIYKLTRFMYKTLILYVLNGLPYSP